MFNRRRWLLTEKNGFKRLKSTLNGSKRSLNGSKWFKTAFSSSKRLLMTRSGFIEPKIALNYSIPMDIHFRSIFVDFWIFKKLSSKIQLFLKNRNLGRNFVLAENHWKLTLGQFWENFFGHEKFFSEIQFFTINRYLSKKYVYDSISLTKNALNDHAWL